MQSQVLSNSLTFLIYSEHFIFLTRAVFKKMNAFKKTHRCIKTKQNHQHAAILLCVSVSSVPHHV